MFNAQLLCSDGTYIKDAVGSGGRGEDDSG